MRLEGWLARHQALLLAVLVVLGVGVRLAWLATTTTGLLNIGETQNVAIAFSKTGAIADPFRPGQGPTAHVMPLTPIVAGTVYSALGVDTPASKGVLTGLSLALVFGGYLLFFRAFGRLGVPLVARFGAFGFASLFPLNVALETVAFRVWEGGLAVFLAALCLDQLLRLDGAPAISRRDMVGMGLLAAACLFVSPAIGLAAYTGGLLLMVRRTAPRRWPGTIAIVAVTAAIVLAPWALRNAAVMGRPILLRDNFGLELAQAYHPAASVTSDPRRTFVERHRAIHPFGDGSGGAYAALQAAGGEVAYFDGLAAEARAWIAANPGAAARLTGDHLAEMLFPPPWYWEQFGKGSKGTLVKLGLNWAISALALAGLVLGLRQAGARYAYVAFFAQLPILPYLLVQPTLRYRYLVMTLFTFIAADCLSRLWRRERDGA